MASERTHAAHFAVSGTHIDGKTGGTLTIEPGERGRVTFRPTGSHREYALGLAYACEVIAWRAARLDAEREKGRR